jgi:hypothetical protein
MYGYASVGLSFSSLLRILPVGPFGRDSRNSTGRRFLYLAFGVQLSGLLPLSLARKEGDEAFDAFPDPSLEEHHEDDEHSA